MPHHLSLFPFSVSQPFEEKRRDRALFFYFSKKSVTISHAHAISLSNLLRFFSCYGGRASGCWF
jgi:hypothetical protein